MDFVVCPECKGLVDLNGGNCYSSDRGINIFHATCHIVRLELERDRDWKAVDALSPRFRHPDFKFASFAGAVEAMIKDREDADAKVSVLRAALETVQVNHAGMSHHAGCQMSRHSAGDCACAGPLIDDDGPCVDGECECCLSSDVIRQALAATTSKDKS